MKKKLNFKDIYNHLEEIILVILFVAMVAVIFLQVIMRYVFNNSLSWSEEVGRFIFQWLTWIGMSLGARAGQHIKITFLIDKLSYKMAQVANIASETIVIVICVLTVQYGIELAKMFVGARFVSMGISLSWGYASIIVGCSLMVIRSLESIIKSFRILVSNNSAPKIEEGGAS